MVTIIFITILFNPYYPTTFVVCLIDLILATQSTIFQLCQDRSSWVHYTDLRPFCLVVLNTLLYFGAKLIKNLLLKASLILIKAHLMLIINDTI